MLFNSYAFIFGFLPVTLLGFFLLGRVHRRLATLWLVAASLLFYGWWNAQYVGLLLASIVFNYFTALAITRTAEEQRRGRLLFFGIACNLLLLAYYKYTGFLIHSVGALLGDAGLRYVDTELPLGISFFTFTQIAFLVDVRRRLVAEQDPAYYGLFVTYFPHLLAGPVLHHKEMMPQFAHEQTYRPNANNLASGLTLFTFGLFKKVVIADMVGPWATEIFDRTDANELTFLVAWLGAIAYALQIYFDFSGYSDMAIGISRLFGIELPINFNSPYKSNNIIEFWRRWHMTLSRFLRDYLYIPLGGNRLGPARRQVNLMLTMLLGGLWHGAGWVFVIWGGLHGLYLVINHAAQALGKSGSKVASGWSMWGGRLLTFAAVTVAWVFFRAKDLDRALELIAGMAGLKGVTLPAGWAAQAPPLFALRGVGVQFHDLVAIEKSQLLVLGGLMAFVMLAPNTQEVMQRWRPSVRWLLLLSAMIVICLGHMGARVSEFLYYQF